MPKLLARALALVCAAASTAVSPAASPASASSAPAGATANAPSPRAWPAPVAHRGGAKESDENTLDAFRASLAAGCSRIETDIRMTRDGALVLMHDNTVARTTTATGSVEDMSAAEVRALRTKKTGASVPFLDDLLALRDGHPGLFLQLELKTNKKQYPDAVLAPYCLAIHRAVSARCPSSAFAYSSFDRRALAAMRRVAPDARLILLARACDETNIAAARSLGASAISCKLSAATPETVAQARRAGLVVGGWSAPALSDYQQAAELGLAFVTTDRPAEVIAWLAAQPTAASPAPPPAAKTN